MANIFHQIFINQMANFWANNSLVFSTRRNFSTTGNKQKIQNAKYKKRNCTNICQQFPRNGVAINIIRLPTIKSSWQFICDFFHAPSQKKIAKRNQNEINKKNFHKNLARTCRTAPFSSLGWSLLSVVAVANQVAFTFTRSTESESTQA